MFALMSSIYRALCRSTPTGDRLDHYQTRAWLGSIWGPLLVTELGQFVINDSVLSPFLAPEASSLRLLDPFSDTYIYKQSESWTMQFNNSV